MTTVAIYARVSTDEQALSAEAQERDARRFAEARGWVVAEVYADVGVSGAEWTSRPELLRMLSDASRPGRGWSVVVMRDLDRLGRDAARTALALEGLHDAGVRVLEYSTGSEVQQDPMARVLLATRAAFAEYERAMNAERTRGALADLARRGYVTGGRVYGYRNVRGPAGVTREIEPAEAAIVREIFARRAAGEPVADIARSLNTRGVSAPRATSWAPAAVGGMLRCTTYRGEVVWGRTRKGYRKGAKTRTPQPAAEHLRTTVPALVIVDTETWEAVQRAWQAPRGPRPVGGRNLLTGFLRCAACGGPVGVRRARWGSETVATYECAWSHQRGEAVCRVRSRRPVERVDAAVLDWIGGHLLHPAVVRAAAAKAADLILAEADAPSPAADLRAELARIEGEGRRLAEAIARGGDLDALTVAIQARQDRARAIRAELGRVEAPQGLPLDRATLLQEAEARAAELRGLLARDVEGARGVLRAVFAAPLRFAPGEGRGAPWRVEGLPTGSMVASPRGVGVTPCVILA